MKLVALACTLTALVPVARADEPLDRPEGFEVDREAPPPGQAEFSFDGGAQVTGWAVSASGSYLDRPMRLHTTRVKTFPVDRRGTLALGGALAIGPAILVDARMAVAHQSGDRMQGLGDNRPLDTNVVGDLGLGARLRVAERPRFAAFVRAQVTLPTGDDFDYAGETRFTAAWMLIGRAMLPQGVVIAGTAGVRFRGREVIVADRLLGDELFAGIGASYQLPAIPGLYCDANEVRLTGELVGVLGNDVGNHTGSSPAEGRIGIVTKIRPWLAVAARVGKGIDDQIGAPRLRGTVELVYVGGAR